jgi:hypothetical protein
LSGHCKIHGHMISLMARADHSRIFEFRSWRMHSLSILSPWHCTMRCAMVVLTPPRLRKAPMASHFCSSLPCSSKLQMESTPPHSSTMSQLLGLCLQMLHMQPAASRLSSSSEVGASIKETSRGMPFKSRMRSRAAMPGRAAKQKSEANLKGQTNYDHLQGKFIMCQK